MELSGLAECSGTRSSRKVCAGGRWGKRPEAAGVLPFPLKMVPAINPRHVWISMRGMMREEPLKKEGFFRVLGSEGCDSLRSTKFGTVAIDQSVWQQWIGTHRALNTSLFLKPEFDVNTVRDALRLQFPGLDIRNGQELRDVVLTIFHQNFRVTFALNTIGIVVALVGLILSMLALFVESTSTWKTLNYLGFHSRSFIHMAGLESASIALSAWLGGTVVGLGLGWLLIYVINVESFGWTLLWSIPFTSLLLLGAGLVLCGYVCGFLTGMWWQTYKR